jgi:hypothetical protein
MTTLKESADKELKQMEIVFDKTKVRGGEEYYKFAETYFKDGKYFFEKGKYLEAFEAAVIAWAYIDFGLKLKWFEVPVDLKKNFTAN